SFLFFLLYCSLDLRYLHSFPTRRSSDLSGAHGRANFRHQHTALAGEFEDFAEWNFQVFLNVVAQRLERRHVENFRAVKQSSDKRSEEHTSELQSRGHLVCRLLLEKKK